MVLWRRVESPCCRGVGIIYAQPCVFAGKSITNLTNMPSRISALHAKQDSEATEVSLIEQLTSYHPVRSVMEASRSLSRATRSLCRFTTSSFLAPFLTRPAVPCLANATTRAFSSTPFQSATTTPRQLTDKERAAREKMKRRKKKHRAYKQHNLKDMQQFTLCEAMR